MEEAHTHTKIHNMTSVKTAHTHTRSHTKECGSVSQQTGGGCISRIKTWKGGLVGGKVLEQHHLL